MPTSIVMEEKCGWSFFIAIPLHSYQAVIAVLSSSKIDILETLICVLALWYLFQHSLHLTQCMYYLGIGKYLKIKCCANFGLMYLYFPDSEINPNCLSFYLMHLIPFKKKNCILVFIVAKRFSLIQAKYENFSRNIY